MLESVGVAAEFGPPHRNSAGAFGGRGDFVRTRGARLRGHDRPDATQAPDCDVAGKPPSFRARTMGLVTKVSCGVVSVRTRKKGIATVMSERDVQARAEWLGLLARAPVSLLEAWFARQPSRAVVWLRRPETGLVMVRGRAGGTGAKFNLGEMALTRCALRLDGGAIGIAYVQGRSLRKAELAALADALLQMPQTREAVRRELVEPLRARLEAERARAQRRAQSTRVQFFTLAREAAE